MWTYRIVKESNTGSERYGICEVYGERGHTDPVTVDVFTENIDGDDPIASLRWQLTEMLKALDKPVLIPALAMEAGGAGQDAKQLDPSDDSATRRGTP